MRCDLGSSGPVRLVWVTLELHCLSHRSSDLNCSDCFTLGFERCSFPKGNFRPQYCCCSLSLCLRLKWQSNGHFLCYYGSTRSSEQLWAVENHHCLAWSVVDRIRRRSCCGFLTRCLNSASCLLMCSGFLTGSVLLSSCSSTAWCCRSTTGSL